MQDNVYFASPHFLLVKEQIKHIIKVFINFTDEASVIWPVIDEVVPAILFQYKAMKHVAVNSVFYNNDRIIGVDDDVMARRIMMTERTLMILEIGMRLLGLETLERM